MFRPTRSLRAPVRTATWAALCLEALSCARGSPRHSRASANPSPRGPSAATSGAATARGSSAPSVATALALAPRARRPAQPATNVRVVALADETRGARQNSRSGTATRIPTPNIQPTAFRTPDGFAGWRVTFGGGRALATPAVVGGRVFIGGGFGSHEFYALDERTGRVDWAVRVSDDGPTAAVVEDNRVAFNTESCTLFVLNARSGESLWSRWLGDPLMSQPAIADGRVYMAFPHAGSHRLVALSLRDGSELWRVPVEGDVISAPVAHGDSVYVTTFDGTVYRHRANDGALAWRESYRATSAPWLDGDDIYVSHREDNAQAAVPGRQPMFVGGAALLFRVVAQSIVVRPTESVGRMSAGSGASTQDHGGFAPRAAPWLDSNVQRRSHYNREQGASDTAVGFSTPPAAAQANRAMENVGQGTVRGMWEYQGSRPIVINGRLFLTQGDQLVAMDAGSGQTHWRRPLSGVLAEHGGHLASPPSAAGGNLYLATVTGDIVVVAQSDGSVVRSIRVGAPMRFQPAVVHGWLFVGTADGQVIGLDLRDPSATGWPMWGGGPAHNGVQT